MRLPSCFRIKPTEAEVAEYNNCRQWTLQRVDDSPRRRQAVFVAHYNPLFGGVGMFNEAETPAVRARGLTQRKTHDMKRQCHTRMDAIHEATVLAELVTLPFADF